MTQSNATIKFLLDIRDIHICRELQTIQIKLTHLCLWAEPVVFGSTKTALKFKYKI